MPTHKLAVKYRVKHREHEGYCSDAGSCISRWSYRNRIGTVDIPDKPPSTVSLLKGEVPDYVYSWLDKQVDITAKGSGYCGGKCSDSYEVLEVVKVIDD